MAESEPEPADTASPDPGPEPNAVATSPSFERELLAAFEAGQEAFAAGRYRRDNPHQGDGPGELALSMYWGCGFDSVHPAAAYV